MELGFIPGDRWKKLASDERRQYLQEAKQLAEEQKRRHPDCWKRKRTMSTGVCYLIYCNESEWHVHNNESLDIGEKVSLLRYFG